MYINFQNPIYTASKSRYLVVRNATQFRFNSRNHGYQNRVGKLSIRRNPVSVFSSSSSGQYNQYIKQKDVGKNDSDDEEEAEESQDQQRRNGPFTRARKLVQFIFLQFKKVLMGILSIFKMLLPIGDNKYRSVQILISFILGAWFLLSTDPGQKGRSTKFPKEVKYSNFVQYINQGQVKSVQFEENTSRVYFWIENQKDAQTQNQNLEQNPTSEVKEQTQFSKLYTRQIPGDNSMVPMLLRSGIEFGVRGATPGSTINRIVGTALALWLPLLPFIFIMKRLIEGRMDSKRKGKSGQGAPQPPRTTFADVAGVDTAVEELKEVIQCMKNPERYQRMKASMPSGVLLCGPPGTGKTLLAKAVAGEANVPFFAASASEFVEMFVGRGAARIRELFAEARKRAPAVVFIDELDAVGSRRGVGYNDERDQTLNQLLTELDGFEARTGVLLLAATNRQDILDPALLRPGRLSRKITVPLPDENARNAILQVHMRDTPCEGGEEGKKEMCQQLAKVTFGFSGADLANVVNEAALLAVRQESDFLQVSDLIEGARRTKFGVTGKKANFGKGLQEFLDKFRQPQQPVQMTYGS
eukprot:TRINITY_DN3723_c1_g2_i4.p1 TRINITY_DN3723_c1_g2~~TRINITY_DN3723_c1_g2_i4.p1  ORF type:complete len:584 (+),score=65.90 TRINITY_DN3723_c1_g2_i4:277-2028(+)